jgi:hypothetical protein
VFGRLAGYEDVNDAERLAQDPAMRAIVGHDGRHGRYVVFQLAEVAVPRALFAEILRRIDRLRPRPLVK